MFGRRPSQQQRQPEEETFSDAAEASQQYAGRAGEEGERTMQQAGETAEGVSNAAQEKGGELQERAGQGVQEAKERGSQVSDQAREKGGELKDQAGEVAGQAREKAEGVTEQTKEKAGSAVDQTKQKGQEFWEGEQGQQIRGQATEFGDRAGDAARRTKDAAGNVTNQAREGGSQFMTEIKEEGEGQGWGGEIGRRTKQAGHTIQEKAQDPEARDQFAQTAGKFIGTMRAQGGGIGQETEAFGRGAEMVSNTAQQAWQQVPEGAKETVIAGGKKLADTTDRLWTKTFNLVEKLLDKADKTLFTDDDDGGEEQHPTPQGGDIESGQGQPNHGVGAVTEPLLKKTGLKKDPKEKERQRKQKERRQSITKLVTKVVGYVIILLLLTLMMFFLGFFLLPVLFIALLFLLIGFQCWACCGTV